MRVELRIHSLLNVILGQIVAKQCLVGRISGVSGRSYVILHVDLLLVGRRCICHLPVTAFLRTNSELVVVRVLGACLAEHAYQLGLDKITLTDSSRLITASMN